MFNNDEQAVAVARNKAIRGYIIRALVKGNNYSMIAQQIINAMLQDNLILSPDGASKHFAYLVDGGYIKFTDKKITAYQAYRNNAVIALTKEGIDLAEGTITDAGVDI